MVEFRENKAPEDMTIRHLIVNLCLVSFSLDHHES